MVSVTKVNHHIKDYRIIREADGNMIAFLAWGRDSIWRGQEGGLGAAWDWNSTSIKGTPPHTSASVSDCLWFYSVLHDAEVVPMNGGLKSRWSPLTPPTHLSQHCPSWFWAPPSYSSWAEREIPGHRGFSPEQVVRSPPELVQEFIGNRKRVE